MDLKKDVMLLFSVLDDDDSSITAGSIVTVTVTLKRRDMGELFQMGDSERTQAVDDQQMEDEPADDDENKVSPRGPGPEVIKLVFFRSLYLFFKFVLWLFFPCVRRLLTQNLP
jgi:hypothetical protein